MGAQTTRLEAVDDSLGPLGPLGDNVDAPSPMLAEQPPAPPQKETPTKTGIRSPPASSPPPALSINKNMMDSVDLEDEDEEDRLGRARAPPPVNPPWTPQAPRRTERSVSVEQAAKPTFDITVGDPHKVGDLTTSHIVYQVRTKVSLLVTIERQPLIACQTSSKAYKQPEFAVSRRYRDFLWLYNQLHTNNPGVVVPPPPEKQAVGRFDSNFVESRRAALERMLNKSAAHPILQHDGDLKLFLESEAFNVDVKHKERKEPGLGESKGMFSSFGLSVGSSGKFIEHDDVSRPDQVCGGSDMLPAVVP